MIVRNTFIDIESASEESTDNSQSQSKSDSEGLSKARSRSASESGESRFEQIADLKEWHKKWVSSSDSSGQKSSRSGSNDETQTENESEKVPLPTEFKDTLKLARRLQMMVDAGMHVRDAIKTEYPHLDLVSMVPKNDSGEALSVGSVWHLAKPYGTRCKGCDFFRKGKCHKREKCLYCHFPEHKKKPSEGPPQPPPPRDVSRAKARRERRKQVAERYKLAAEAAAAEAATAGEDPSCFDLTRSRSSSSDDDGKGGGNKAERFRQAVNSQDREVQGYPHDSEALPSAPRKPQGSQERSRSSTAITKGSQGDEHVPHVVPPPGQEARKKRSEFIISL